MSQSRYEFLKEKYVRTNILSDEELMEIIEADPTTIFMVSEDGNEGRLEKVGKYTQWILKMYDTSNTYMIDDDGSMVVFEEEKARFFEDLYKIHDDLVVYDVIKTKKDLIPKEKKDINQLKTAMELYGLVNPYYSINTMNKTELKQKIIREDVDVLYDGVKWDIISPLTSDAAIAMSGPPLTRWCTATEGRNYFDTYNNRGKLYILRDKTDILESGRAEGQPRPIYQFHFETNSFMDIHDSQVDLTNILQTQEELKRFFKPIMMKYYLTSKMVDITYPKDNVSKFITIYGFEDFLESLPTDITDLSIDCKNAAPAVKLRLPRSIARFKNLQTLYLRACVVELPEELGQLEALENISFPDNKSLREIPKSLANLKRLMTINFKGCDLQIPNEIKLLDEANKIFLIN
jgi:hypothetical protein